MKKFLSLALILCFIIPCAVIFSGCGFKTNVKYYYTDVELSWASAEERIAILGGQSNLTDEQVKEKIKTYQMYFCFNDDGTCDVATYPLNAQLTEQDITDAFYTKEDDVIKVYADKSKLQTSLIFTLTVRGKKLVLEEKFSTGQNSTYKMIFTSK